jgi:hypothetical protein
MLNEKNKMAEAAIEAAISAFGIYTNSHEHIASYEANGECERLSVMTRHAQQSMPMTEKEATSAKIRNLLRLIYADLHNLDQRNVSEETATESVETLLVSLGV